MQTPISISDDDITIVLSSHDQAELVSAIHKLVEILYGSSGAPLKHRRYRFTDNDYRAFWDFRAVLLRAIRLQTGDACRHPVQSPVVVGQGGTITTCRHRLNSGLSGACPGCQSSEPKSTRVGA